MAYKKKNNYNNKLLREAEMSGNKQLSALRISSDLFNKFIKAIETFNSNNLVEFDISTFHKIAIAYLSEQILNGEFEITFDVKK